MTGTVEPIGVCAQALSTITPAKAIEAYDFIVASLLRKARQAALMELRVGDRAALLFHPRLAKSGICPQQLVVLFAFDHVLPRGPRL
jgi:hypothetical protein